MAHRRRKPGSVKSAKKTSGRTADADSPLWENHRHHGATRKWSAMLNYVRQYCRDLDV